MDENAPFATAPAAQNGSYLCLRALARCTDLPRPPDRLVRCIRACRPLSCNVQGRSAGCEETERTARRECMISSFGEQVGAGVYV